MGQISSSSKWPLKICAGSVTVKVYKTSNRGRSLYQMAFRDHHGKRQRRSFADLNRAKSEARQMAMQLQRGEVQILKLHGEDRLAYERASKRLAALGIPIELMTAEYVEAREILGDNGSLVEASRFFVAHGGFSMVARTTKELVLEYIEQKQNDGCSIFHIQDLQGRLSRFHKTFPCPISEVSTGELQRWLNGMNVAARTRNNVRSKLIALFTYARMQGYLPKNIDTAAQGISRARERGGQIEIFSPDQMAQLLESATDHGIRTYLALGAFTGLRAAELQRLEWQDIDLEEAHLEVKAAKAKTAQRRLVPIQANLRTWLEPVYQKSGKVFGIRAIARKVADFSREQKIEWPNNGLRHSYASYRLAACQDTPKVALEMGNSPQIIFRNYRAVVSPRLADKWWQIESS